LPGVAAAARFYKTKHKSVTPKRVADVVAELLALKKSRGASLRYLQDLRLRLDKFAEKFPCNIGSVTTPDVQTWLDGLKLSSQSYANNRRVAHLLFEFAVARGYAMDNPTAKVERPKIRNGEVEIFTPGETRRLLAAAPEDFLPCLALGMFAGLRSAEIERLEWKDIDLKQAHVVVSASNAKTASRRIVPIAENLAKWLKTYAGRTGKVWQGGWLYKAQQDTAKAAGVDWKANGCRHSCASYMFALTNDAGRIAGFLGNSAAVIHRHYRQLATPADAQKFFSVKPATAVNVLPLAATVN
jgi:integrase